MVFLSNETKIRIEPTVKRLTGQDRYQTSRVSPSLLARRSPDVVFYAHATMIVLKAARLAKDGRYTNAHWVQSSLDTVKAMECVGGYFELENLYHHLKLRSPCVYIGNHMSVLETFVLPCLIQPYRDVTFIVKESLMTYPIFGHVMQSRKPIVVSRENPRKDLRTVLEGGQRRLDGGTSVIIFPQTTRSPDFNPKKFNTLGIKLAKRAGVPVVPIALKTDAWGLGSKLKDFGRVQPQKQVHICFGDPLKIDGSGKRTYRRVVDFITGKLNAWS